MNPKTWPTWTRLLVGAVLIAGNAVLPFLTKSTTISAPVHGVLVTLAGIWLLLVNTWNAQAPAENKVLPPVIMCLTLSLFACKPSQLPVINSDITTVEQIACIGAGSFATPQDAALACGFVQDAGQITQAVIDLVSKFMAAQKLAADPAFKARVLASRDGGVVWHVDAGAGL